MTQSEDNRKNNIRNKHIYTHILTPNLFVFFQVYFLLLTSLALSTEVFFYFYSVLNLFLTFVLQLTLIRSAE